MHEFARGRDRELIERVYNALGSTPSSEVIDGLERYLELVVHWNRRLDLTAARSATAQVEVMLGDAAVLADGGLIDSGTSFVDVGTGAGAPALPLLLLRRDLEACLVEPKRKRVAFLRNALAQLGLTPRATVIERRLAPDAVPSLGRRFGVALSRATFAPEQWLPLGGALSDAVLVMLAGAPTPPSSSGLSLAREREYRLPLSGAPRRVVRYER